MIMLCVYIYLYVCIAYQLFDLTYSCFYLLIIICYQNGNPSTCNNKLETKVVGDFLFSLPIFKKMFVNWEFKDWNLFISKIWVTIF